ncbi:MAG: acyl-CoA/acyl-ACP dehydrogenase [Chloroflexi bacterium]|nr:acyl-CoA/acyl-ACP dehydrogenase [Chloroflexota bacterium]
MDLGLNETQEILKKTARDFLESECPKSLVRAMEEDVKGYSPELWRKMAELGWLGLLLPAEYGGAGGDWVDAAVLLEEMGRALLPGPFIPTAVVAALAILEAGTPVQKDKHLSGIANGDTIISPAILEPEGAFSARFIQARAAEDAAGYVIDGVKLFVPDANVADYLLAAVRTSDGVGSDDGVTVLIVDARSEGIEVTPLVTVAADNQCEVALKGVRVSRADVLGQVDQGWRLVRQMQMHGAAATSASMVGGAERVFEMAVSYAKERVQFGRPIGSFQAIQHKCADMLVDVDGARFITYQAVWKLSEGLDGEADAAMAKSWVGDAYRRVLAHSNQIHGGLAFSKEFDLGLYFRRARAAEFAYGDGVVHRDAIARQILG